MPKPTRVRSRSTSIRNPILRWWLRDPIERWAFRLAAVYMRRDRDIKLRLYPSLSIFLVFPLISLLDRNRGVFSAFMPLMTIWMLGSIPISALETLRMSPHYAAADIFAVAPLSSAAPVFHGVRKAIIFYLLVPSICLAGILFAYLAPGGRESLLLAVPGLIAIPTLSLLPGLVEEYLPLSRPAARGEQSARNMGLVFLTMLAMLGVVGGDNVRGVLAENVPPAPGYPPADPAMAANATQPYSDGTEDLGETCPAQPPHSSRR